MPKPPLSVINVLPSNVPEPVRPLKADGRALWDRAHSEWCIEDSQGLHLLQLAAETLDSVSEMQRQIDEEGLTVRSRTGVFKEHPLLRPLLAGRAFIAKLLGKQLGIDLQPQRGPGRPPGRGA
jgi:hypothetical protein